MTRNNKNVKFGVPEDSWPLQGSLADLTYSIPDLVLNLPLFCGFWSFTQIVILFHSPFGSAFNIYTVIINPHLLDRHWPFYQSGKCLPFMAVQMWALQSSVLLFTVLVCRDERTLFSFTAAQSPSRVIYYHPRWGDNRKQALIAGWFVFMMMNRAEQTGRSSHVKLRPVQHLAGWADMTG